MIGNVVQIRDIMLGEGMPKICVPIIGTTQKDILDEAINMKKLPVDIVEWRVDWYEDSKKIERVLETASMLREYIGETPILFTIRTDAEGGETRYTLEEYREINMAVAKSGFIDMVDVEIYREEKTVDKIIQEVHRMKKLVIASNHDFYGTPEKEELIKRLCYMQEQGADVLKVAVMPQSTKDVITLLDATREMVEEHARKPVVTMSMASCGRISRVAGEIFGSAMTFGTGEAASAPGQIDVWALKDMLQVLHGK